MSEKVAKQETAARELALEHEASLSSLREQKAAAETAGAKNLADAKQAHAVALAEMEKQLQKEVAATAAARQEVVAREEELSAAKQAVAQSAAAAEKAASASAGERSKLESLVKQQAEEAARKLKDAESTAERLKRELDAATAAKSEAVRCAASPPPHPFLCVCGPCIGTMPHQPTLFSGAFLLASIRRQNVLK